MGPDACALKSHLDRSDYESDERVVERRGRAVVIRVLVVDDTADVRMFVSLVLEATGLYEVVDQASDGREAVALATMHQPDAIVIDQMMPDLSGSDAVPLLRQAAPDAKILMFSAVAAEVMVGRDGGADGCVNKGDIDGLLETMAALCGAESATPQNCT